MAIRVHKDISRTNVQFEGLDLKPKALNTYTAIADGDLITIQAINLLTRDGHNVQLVTRIPYTDFVLRSGAAPSTPAELVADLNAQLLQEPQPDPLRYGSSGNLSSNQYLRGAGNTIHSGAGGYPVPAGRAFTRLRYSAAIAGGPAFDLRVEDQAGQTLATVTIPAGSTLTTQAIAIPPLAADTTISVRSATVGTPRPSRANISLE